MAFLLSLNKANNHWQWQWFSGMKNHSLRIACCCHQLIYHCTPAVRGVIIVTLLVWAGFQPQTVTEKLCVPSPVMWTSWAPGQPPVETPHALCVQRYWETRDFTLAGISFTAKVWDVTCLVASLSRLTSQSAEILVKKRQLTLLFLTVSILYMVPHTEVYFEGML